MLNTDKLYYCSGKNDKFTKSKLEMIGRSKKSSRDTGTFLLKTGQSREKRDVWESYTFRI
jgi:hypothetical protein